MSAIITIEVLEILRPVADHVQWAARYRVSCDGKSREPGLIWLPFKPDTEGLHVGAKGVVLQEKPSIQEAEASIAKDLLSSASGFPASWL